MKYWCLAMSVVVCAALMGCAQQRQLDQVATADELRRGDSPHPITTFSIVAYDPETGDYGVAVQSRYFAVGDVVPFARAGVGAIATQARGNITYGPKGLQLCADGVPAEQVIKDLVDGDPLANERQVGVVDAKGHAATYTGKGCLPWAGGKTGKHYAVQGNILAGPEVVEAMAATFEAAPGDLAERMVYAIAAGQAAGGDARGRQSAAVLVVRKKAGYLGLTDRLISLHVEDHPTPIRELHRLLNIRHAQMASVAAEALLKQAAAADEAAQPELVQQARVQAERGLKYYRGDDHLWWLAAEARLKDGDRAGALEAGKSALLIAPSWPRLPESTRAALGLDESLVTELRKDDAFNRLWVSLAAKETKP